MNLEGTKTPLPPWAMAVTAMLMIQLSSALSVGLIEEVGAAGTAWLRLCMGALIFLLLARPPIRFIRRRDLPALLGLGAATGLMSVAFLAAIDRIPLGTAVAIEFLGPLTVAAIRSHSRRMLAWPGLALAGVILLTEPWHGEVDLAGIGFAVLAGTGWGVYILLTQRVGDRFSGISALSLTIPIAAAMAAFVGVPQVVGHLDWRVLLIAAGLALLAPVLPFGLEMLALRRMTHTAFGTLMALEPAFGVVLGLIVLHQIPSLVQVAGIMLVVLAGAGAQRGGTRTGENGNPTLVLKEQP
ncbi:EamA family transporter [Saxibacter everestensis]|uniref:EamA family transporter n=1 Tax=Saxibacter everestensis TaxID=2909229 RepID=A0ABY8QXU3_9MICO|nr:EamA family transporter [Brevibacteriaceae bacterium ZFBP1038]